MVDSSICGLNSQITIPERTTLPSALDVLRVYPLRNLDDSLLGFSLDVKSAHKLVLRKTEQGLVGFSLDGAIYLYKVCPFGASFSAYHWTRLGSFLLRWFHHLLWLQHAGLLYVDDFFFISPQNRWQWFWQRYSVLLHRWFDFPYLGGNVSLEAKWNGLDGNCLCHLDIFLCLKISCNAYLTNWRTFDDLNDALRKH